MTKKIFTLLIALITLSFVLPTTVRANTAIELIDQNFQGISISVYGSVLRVEGANDETMYIYNVTGDRVMSVKIDGADKRYNLNLPKGCYIVKVGKVTRKIVIR